MAAAQPNRKPRLGIITYASQSDAFQGPMIGWVVEGLARQGYVNAKSIDIQCHYGERDEQTMTLAASSLAQWGPDVIVSMMTNADLAVIAATEDQQTPVVCWSMDPIDSGLLTSMSRPGGRLTGASFPPGFAWMQLRACKILLPNAKRLGYLHNPSYAPASGALQKMHQAAQAMGLELDVKEVTEKAGIAPAMLSLQIAGCQGLLVGPHELFNSNGGLIGETALSLNLPAIGQESVAKGGGLLAFMPDFRRIWETVAHMAAQILQGGLPTHMPIDRHISPLMILNTKAATQMGIHIPELFADEATSFID